MVTLVTNLAALMLGALLAATGASKTFSRHVARQAAGTVLVRVLNDGRRATRVLRATGIVELLVAAALLLVPTAVVPGAAAIVLGLCFVGYLGYARVAAPGSSCGCSARSASPIGWRTFVRAALVVAAGAANCLSRAAWWTELARRPVSAAVCLVVIAALLVAVSSDLDHMWLVPLRRARLRIFGHPLIGSDNDVPVAASIELLEHSLAWVATSSLVRSAVIDHWEADGWRFLRYAGVRTVDGAARPVTVLYSVDPRQTRDTTPVPAVRVTVIDDLSDEPVPVEL